MMPGRSNPRRAAPAGRLAGMLASPCLLALAACTTAAPPPPQAVSPIAPPPAAFTAGPAPLTIVDPPVEPGRPVAVVRGGEPRPVVLFEQPERVSPPGTPLVLPPPIPREARQETLVEAVPTRIVLGRGEQRRLVAFLRTAGEGRFDALHLEMRGRNRGAVAAMIATARRAGVDPAKIRAVDAAAPGGAVEVIATRYVATAPACPSLAIVGPSVNDNDFEPTLGCSNRGNLAAMVNDPADLLGSRAVAPADGARAGAVIERYRTPAAAGAGYRGDGVGQAPIEGGYGYGPPGGSILGSGGPVGR